MANLKCEHCHKNVGTVTVIEVPPSADSLDRPAVSETVLCEICAQAKNLPHAPVGKKSLGAIWKLLQASGSKPAKEDDVICPDCGMRLSELRERGRIGCERDYELFGDDINDILERVHGATQHQGRTPAMSTSEFSRQQVITDLQSDLDKAIQEEAYENAARIRDELETLGHTVK